MAIVGIDLGTTNSLITVFKDGQCIFIPNQYGDILTPSVVSIVNKEIIVGKIAKERLITDPEHTVAAFKIFMGSDKTYKIDHKKYTPIDLSSMIIKQLIEDARNYLNEDIEEAIISVPAYFNDAKRLATKQAGELAGIKVERIVNEPSAAALATSIHSSEFETLLIFDFGGGTLDVSIVDCFENVVEIVSVSGDNHLGGEEFNKVIEDYFIETNHLPQLSLKESAILKRNIEEMKKYLSNKNEIIKTVYLAKKKYDLCLSRDILFEISDNLLYRIKNVVGKALKDANINVTDIDRLIMVGGSSKLTIVQEYLEYLFHLKPEINQNIDYLVGLGCGYVAGIKERNQNIKDKVLTDICPFSLGVAIHNRFGNDLLFSVIIERNATLPCSQIEYYTTSRHGQKKLEFQIFQGEDIIAKNNHYIGKMEIEVPPAVLGQEVVEVCFTYDINGILDVDITSQSTQKNIHKVFTNEECTLSSKELNQRIEELQQFKQNNHHQEIDYLLEKANRMYEENVGIRREKIEQFIYELMKAKESGKKGRIEKLKKILDQLETDSPFIYEKEDIIN